MSFYNKINLTLVKSLATSIVHSGMFRNYMSLLVMHIFQSLIQIHIISLACVLFTTNWVLVDFFIQIFVTIFLSKYSERYIFLYLLSPNKNIFDNITFYLIENYSRKKLVKWKNWVILFLSIYICIIMYYIEINNNIIILYTFQNLVVIFVSENLEYAKKNIITYFKIYYFQRPKKIIYSNLHVIENFYVENSNDENEIEGFVIIS
jgi:hypothetical protein